MCAIFQICTATSPDWGAGQAQSCPFRPHGANIGKTNVQNIHTQRVLIQCDLKMIMIITVPVLKPNMFHEVRRDWHNSSQAP